MDGHQAIRLPFLSPIHAPLPNRSQGWCTHFSMILGIPSSKGRWRKRGTRLPLFTIHHLLLPADDQENGIWRRSSFELYHSYEESDIINFIKIQRTKWVE
ncbi:uncharacterized protein TNCV_1359571 [Trichonephila clavipes]|nr:uncharacterized protein TNCV_1359571 [Trichonephila clavipes]